MILLLAAVVTVLLFVYLLAALLRPSGSNGERLFGHVDSAAPDLRTRQCALAIPLGLYMAWIFDGRYRAPAGCAGSRTRRHRPAELEAVRRRAAAVQRRRSFVVGFAVLALQPLAAAQPGRQEDARADDDLSTRVCSFLTQHEPAALLRRGAPVVLQPAVRHLLEAVRHAGGRPVRPGGDHPRPARRHAHGQLLPRPVAHRWSTCSCPWRSSWPCC